MSARNLERLILSDVADILKCVSADERNKWVTVGGILKDEYGDAAFDVWTDWSQSSDRYIEKDARAVWRSLGKNVKKAGIGTLIYLAKQNGWRRDEIAAENAMEPHKSTRKASTQKHDTSAYAARLWLAASFDDGFVGAHPYAVSKGIPWAAGAKRGTASGRLIGRGSDCVIVPIRTDSVGTLQGVQCINARGIKQTFGKIAGGCLVLGNTLDRAIPWYVAEGWASAVSVVFHHNNGNAVCAAAFGKHNLRASAEMLGEIFEPDLITVLAECDE